jgi:hypothetical protein
MKFILICAMLALAACSDSGDDTAKVVKASHSDDSAAPTQSAPAQQEQPSATPEPEPTPSGPTYTEITYFDVQFTLAGKRVIASCRHIFDEQEDHPSSCGLTLTECKDGQKYYCITNAQVSEKTEKVLDTDDSNSSN